MEASGTDSNSRLQFTASKRSTIWLDQVSAMPLDTHKVCDLFTFFLFMILINHFDERKSLHLQGHGFRKDLFNMLATLKPGFIRFPGS